VLGVINSILLVSSLTYYEEKTKYKEDKKLKFMIHRK
jgi:hypothetical protein